MASNKVNIANSKQLADRLDMVNIDDIKSLKGDILSLYETYDNIDNQDGATLKSERIRLFSVRNKFLNSIVFDALSQEQKNYITDDKDRSTRFAKIYNSDDNDFRILLEVRYRKSLGRFGKNALKELINSFSRFKEATSKGSYLLIFCPSGDTKTNEELNEIIAQFNDDVNDIDSQLTGSILLCPIPAFEVYKLTSELLTKALHRISETHLRYQLEKLFPETWQHWFKKGKPNNPPTSNLDNYYSEGPTVFKNNSIYVSNNETFLIKKLKTKGDITYFERHRVNIGTDPTFWDEVRLRKIDDGRYLGIGDKKKNPDNVDSTLMYERIKWSNITLKNKNRNSFNEEILNYSIELAKYESINIKLKDFSHFLRIGLIFAQDERKLLKYSVSSPFERYSEGISRLSIVKGSRREISKDLYNWYNAETIGVSFSPDGSDKGKSIGVEQFDITESELDFSLNIDSDKIFLRINRQNSDSLPLEGYKFCRILAWRDNDDFDVLFDLNLTPKKGQVNLSRPIYDVNIPPLEQ